MCVRSRYLKTLGHIQNPINMSDAIQIPSDRVLQNAAKKAIEDDRPICLD